jgi:transposase
MPATKSRSKSVDYSTSSSPGQRVHCEQIKEKIKKNDWSAARNDFRGALEELRVAVGGQLPDRLNDRVISDIKGVIRLAEYFGLLREKEINWLDEYLRKIYPWAVNEAPELDTLHLAISSIAITFRRDPEGFDAAHRQIEEVAAVAEKTISKEPLDSAMASFWSRLFYYRYKIATRRQEREEAERFLDISEHYLSLQARLDPTKAEFILYLKTVQIALQRIFLQISQGRYRHASDLLALVKRELVNGEPEDPIKDPQAALEIAIAESVCIRCLGADSLERLHEASTVTSDAVKRFKDTFKDSRLLLRCWFEQSLNLLLMIDLHKSKQVRQSLIDELKQRIVFMRRSLAKPIGRDMDPSLQTQLNLLESRTLMHDGEIAKAEAMAKTALDIVTGTPLKLLRIEALICLAVTLLRGRKYSDAILRLHKALQLNEESDLLADFSEHSQPALTAASFLYLARVYSLIDDTPLSEKYFLKYDRMKTKVEHAWVVSRLASEVEREVRHSNDSLPFQTRRLHWRRSQMERVMLKSKTARVADIADDLGVSAQTLYGWRREMQANNLHLAQRVFDLADSHKEEKRRKMLLQRKDEIETACRVLATSKIAPIARFLNVSRQTVYNRLNELKEAGMEAKVR